MPRLPGSGIFYGVWAFPWGRAAGASGRFRHVDTGGGETALATKPMGVSVNEGESIVIETPGAGGYGAPGKRAAQALADDLASGKFSAAYLKRCYGYMAGEG